MPELLTKESMTAGPAHDQHRPANYARSAFHVLSAVVGLLLAEYCPWWVVVAVPVTLASVCWFLEFMRRQSERWNEVLMHFFAPVAHPHERVHVNSSTWYATALSLLSLTGSPIAFASGVMTLGVGDPAAALIGRKFGRIKLVNNRTLEGTLTFAVVAFATVLAVLAIWHGEMSTSRTLAVSAAASIVGALTELFSRRVDDNFSIPVVAGAAAWVALAL
jgi:dolichol kinase